MADINNNTTIEAPCEVDIYESVERIETIRLDGLALLQIVKHCHDNTPRCVTGSLLGLESGKVLEITHTFASPDPERDDSNGDQYQIDMMKNLRDINVDNNKVGWYQSTSFGSFISSAVMEYQFQYQEILGPNAVALIYDPTQTTKGSLYLKAFRLTKEFFEHYRKKATQRDGFAKIDIRSDNMIEEIPITLFNTELASCWLYENGRKVAAECDFDRLDLSTNSYLETNLLHLGAWCDELAQEHVKFQTYERAVSRQRAQYQQWLVKRKEENKIRSERGQDFLPEEDPALLKAITPPSRLESLLITKQINTYCGQINRFTGKSYEKLFLVGELNKDE